MLILAFVKSQGYHKRLRVEINSITLTVDLKNQSQIYTYVTSFISFVYKCCKLDLGVDFHILEVGDLNTSSILVLILAFVKSQGYHKRLRVEINSITLTVDLKNQSQIYTYVTSFISFVYKCCKLDLGVDFHILEVGDLK